MSDLIVCRLDQIAETAVKNGVREMVTLLSAGQSFHRPAVIAADRHLKLGMNDIDKAYGGLIAPEEAHVSELIDFVRGWDRAAPLIIHCWLGISRSPAAALVAALALFPDQDELKLAIRLRTASPYVTPNRRIIEIGDSLLGRGGGLVKAIAHIGRGAEASQGNVFRLSPEPTVSKTAQGASDG